MSFIPNQAANTGSFVPTTQVWDVGEIYELKNIDDDFRELLVRLYQNLGNMSTTLNGKISGTFPLQEFVTSALFFNLASSDPLKQRNEYIKVINTGDLSSATYAHGLTIDANWQLTQLYGAASYYDVGTPANSRYLPIPYVSPGGANDISLAMSNTNILVTNNSGITFDKSFVVIKYVKN